MNFKNKLLGTFLMVFILQTNAQEKKEESWELAINSEIDSSTLNQELKALLGDRLKNFRGSPFPENPPRYWALFRARADEIPVIFKDKPWFDRNNLEKEMKCHPAAKK
jgi:hypothetical protein